MSILIGVLVLASSWRVLRESLGVLLEAAPEGIDAEEVGRRMAAVEGVSEVHDLHIWTITSGFPALSAHVLVPEGEDCHARRRELSEMLRRDFGIAHTTLQVEHGEPARSPRPGLALRRATRHRLPAVPARGAATRLLIAGLAGAALGAATAVAQAPAGPFQVVATTPVGPQPGAVTYGYGAVWTLNANGSVSRLDATTGKVTTTSVGPNPRDIRAGYNRIWRCWPTTGGGGSSPPVNSSTVAPRSARHQRRARSTQETAFHPRPAITLMRRRSLRHKARRPRGALNTSHRAQLNYRKAAQKTRSIDPRIHQSV